MGNVLSEARIADPYDPHKLYVLVSPKFAMQEGTNTLMYERWAWDGRFGFHVRRGFMRKKEP
jgi:hypothetical protein